MFAEAIEKIVGLGARAPTPIPLADGGQAVLVPDGYTAERFAPLEQPLPRIRQSVNMHDAASFVAYVNRYKTAETRLFAEPGFLANGQAHVVAVIDYHEPGSAKYGAHVANYVPRYSDQWRFWHKLCGAPLKQVAFAELIEEARADIRDPEAANLLDIVRTFKANKKVDFDSVVYQPGGDVRLAYTEQTQQQGSSGVLPETMTLGIPVYFRGTVYAVPVFVRYRVGGGAVEFQLKLDRADVIEDAAFGELTAAIATACEIEVYLGRRA